MQDEGSEFAGGPICDMGECLCYAGSFRVPLPSDVPSRQPINFGGSLGPKYGRSLDDFAMALGRLASGCPACNGSPKGRRPALNTGELNLVRASRAVGLRDPPLVLTHRWIVVLWRCRLKQKNRVFPRYIVSSRRRVAGSASFYIRLGCDNWEASPAAL